MQGACVYNITHHIQGNAGLDVWFTAGRPNSFGSYSKKILFEVTGEIKDVRHRSPFYRKSLR